MTTEWRKEILAEVWSRVADQLEDRRKLDAMLKDMWHQFNLDKCLEFRSLTDMIVSVYPIVWEYKPEHEKRTSYIINPDTEWLIKKKAGTPGQAVALLFMWRKSFVENGQAGFRLIPQRLWVFDDRLGIPRYDGPNERHVGWMNVFTKDLDRNENAVIMKINPLPV